MSIPEYFKYANEATLVIAIIETKLGLQNIDEMSCPSAIDAASEVCKCTNGIKVRVELDEEVPE